MVLSVQVLSLTSRDPSSVSLQTTLNFLDGFQNLRQSLAFGFTRQWFFPHIIMKTCCCSAWRNITRVDQHSARGAPHKFKSSSPLQMPKATLRYMYVFIRLYTLVCCMWRNCAHLHMNSKTLLCPTFIIKRPQIQSGLTTINL